MAIIRPDQGSGGGGGGTALTVTDGVTSVPNVATLDITSGGTVSNPGGGQANLAIVATPSFSPTATKTANYSAAAGEWVLADPSGGTFTVTLPAAPANGTLVAVEWIGTANSVTVAPGAGDTINATVNATLSTTRRSGIYQYRASDKVWFAIAPATNPVLTVNVDGTTIVNSGTSTAPTLHTGTLDVIAAGQPAAADWSNNSHKITSVTDPTSAQDAATKNYVDSVAAGLDFKQACDLATTAALAANTYVNGASGVGATLTANANGALSVDGTAVSASQRILVKNEAAQSHNGIYVVTQTGSGILPYILTRATDYNQTSEIQAGDATFVTAGATLADTLWVMTTTGAITVGTTAIVFSQFGSTPNLAAVLAVGTSAGAKITNLTNGSAASDAAAFGQIPAAFPAAGRAQYGAGPSKGLVIPGVPAGGSVTTQGLAPNRAQYFMLLVVSQITLANTLFEVTTFQAGSHVRLAIYNADVNWQPTSLVANTDTGSVSTAANGVKTTATTGVLVPGRYLGWLNADTASLAVRAIFSQGPSPQLLSTLGANAWFQQTYVAQTYAAPPDPGLAWDSVATAAGVNYFYPAFYDVASTP